MPLLIPTSGTTTKENIIFTFHYASTYTLPQPDQHSSRLYLHSTMPLLILVISYYISVLIRIYIPLCLYLYPAAIKRQFFALSFTFHYASTYTILRLRLILSDRIYIPLCLYLYNANVATIDRAMIFTFHYASTYTILDQQGSRRKDIYIPLCLYLYYQE